MLCGDQSFVTGGVVVLLTALLSLVGSQDPRGPHHPRGQVSSHTHYRPQRPASTDVPKLTQDTDLLRDADHIREDLGEWVSKEETKNMSPEELEFHYFKLHDFDNNTKLDGLEILQAIQHTVHNNPELTDSTADPTENTQEDDLVYYIELIDRVLAEDDLDKDGYLSYIEYVVGRQKDENKRQGKYSKS
ncbi:multiple coagulation factor deficiency protein 2 homolog [Anabrus simplex]|uniref:multiple coagulation factor deficiency protein 2 homolog n=1 Tax=Anabrus simplex TaxID=316456 RepID=UPI0035A37798